MTIVPLPTRAPADSMVLFYSIDDALRFAATPCHPGTLHAAVAQAMFGNDLLDAEQRKECGEIALTLLDRGSVDFESGWLVLRDGLANVVGAIELPLYVRVAMILRRAIEIRDAGARP